MNALPRLYAIADASFGDPVSLASALFEGGARLLQVRNKRAHAGELLDEVEAILKLASADARVIVNDRADVAVLAGASGVHLGQSDLPVAAARDVLGPDRIIGLSTHNLIQALEADQLPADYIAVGPVFPTSTKENAEPALGIETFGAICRAVKKPVVAIGGIKLENALEILNAGAHSIAVISDVLGASNIRDRVREWITLVG